MERAFATWEAHHPLIRFHDVTNQCGTVRNATTGTVTSSTAGWEYDEYDGKTKPCEAAEFWITAKSNATGSEMSGFEMSQYNWTRFFRKSNGAPTLALGVYETVFASVGFNTDECWYLDRPFCGDFHTFKQALGAENALNVSRVVIFAIWTLAVLEALLAIFYWLRMHLEMLRLEILGLLDTESSDEET